MLMLYHFRGIKREIASNFAVLEINFIDITYTENKSRTLSKGDKSW